MADDVTAQVIQASIDDRNRLEVLIRYTYQGQELETQAFTFSLSDYPDWQSLRDDGLERLNALLDNHIVRLWGEVRNVANLANIITNVVGYSTSRSSVDKQMGDETWTVSTDGTYVVQ